MYSNNKKGFSILDLLVKIIFAALLIFIIVWLFQKKMPKIDLNPLYSNMYRENLSYMQDAGENYFTDDKMPTEIGETIRISLEEMEKKNLIIPFVDKEGKSCDVKNSYVSVTKLEEGYELRTNLICGKESNFVIKTLGCHTYCPNNNCEKKCHVEKIVENQFKKITTGQKTVYSCPSGYKLNGKNCIKTKLIDSQNAIVTTTKTTTQKEPASSTTISGTKTLLKTIVNDKNVQLETKVDSKTTTLAVNKTDKQVSLSVVVGTKKEQLSVKKSVVKKSYSCELPKTEKKCTTKTQKVERKCNCKITTNNGVVSQTCNVCYDSVQVQTCKNVTVKYTGTCTKEETVYSCPSDATSKTGSGTSLKCYKETPTYSCPSDATSSTGSGSSLKCYKTEKAYSCPSDATSKTGSGSSLKCYKTEKVYSCPSDATRKTGSGSSLKCYKTEKVYSCPSETDVTEGKNSSLKCYKVTDGSVKYSCESGWTLKGKECTRTIKESSTSKECKGKNYVLEGDKCNLYKTTTKKATSKKVNTKSVDYKWSTADSISGYSKTGKTRTKDGKKVCE